MKTIEAIDVLVNEMIHDVLAPNYKGWIVADEATGNEYVITVQDKDGESPSEQLAAAKAREDELHQSVADLSNYILEMNMLNNMSKIIGFDGAVYTANEAVNLLAKHKGE